MKKIYFTLVLFASMIFQTYGTVQMVEVRNNEFTPSTFSINIGDTVVWIWSEGTHTTTSATVPPGATAWSEPIDAGNQTFYYVANVAGAYDYLCYFHSSMGMTGNFTVVDPLGISNPKDRVIRLRSSRVNEYLTVEMPELRDYLVPTVRDLTGRAIKNFEVITYETTSLYVGDLKNGIYLLELSSGKRTISYRFIKY